MKKAVIVFESVLLSLLIALTSIIIFPRLSEEEKGSKSVHTGYKPVAVNIEYDPFAEYKIDGCSSEQLFEFFTEVVHTAEFSDGASVHQLTQKWLTPIRYRIYGAPTDEDIRILNGFFDELNNLYYFPGIYEADDVEEENLSIYFIDRKLFDITFGETINYEYADGAAEYWFYIDTSEIYSGRVGYVTDTDQQTRNSVLIEEMVNVLGISDTYIREDSIVYQYSDSNTELSEIDRMIIKTLYHPLILPGMTAEECKNTPLFSY